MLIVGANGLLGRYTVTAFWNAGWKVYGVTSAPVADAPFIPFGAVPDMSATTPPPPHLSTLVIAVGPRIGESLDTAGPRHFDTVKRTVAYARHWGVRRVIYISILGASMESDYPLHRLKAETEALIRQSGLDWTILRPSILFAREHPLFQRLEDWALRPISFVPRSADTFQPVYAGDVAEAILRAANSPGSITKTYNMPGPHPITVRDLVRQMAADYVWWERRTFTVPDRWRQSRHIHWPWTDSEWEYLRIEPLVRDSTWIMELGILPRTLSMFYAPYGRH